MPGELDRARKTLRELGKSLENLPADPAPQRVHRLRTASRRLEAMAVLVDPPDESRGLIKTIEPVRKAAGGVRDMDVLMSQARKLRRYGAGASLAHLLDHLKTGRQQHAAELARVLHHRHHAVVKSVKECTKLVSAAMKREKASVVRSRYERIHDAAMHTIRELGGWPPFDAGNLHDFRLKVKHLRYTLQLDENADPDLLAALDHVQHRIGDWHDWQQLAEIAHEVLNREQDRLLVNRIDGMAKRRFERALTAANALRGKYLAAPMVREV